MITKVVARAFKGLTFEQKLGRFTILLGSIGSGKSARSQALTLALMGYIPGGAKQNAEILSAYGTGDTMVVGFETDKAPGVLLERGFVKSQKGVSQGYKIGGEPAKEVAFITALAKIGSPTMIDISEFMDLSDQKKIDTIFSLYPPAGDVRKIAVDIASAKETISVLSKKKEGSELAAKRLLSSKPTLPPGTLAETVGEIELLEGQLKEARESLAKIKEQEATDKARLDEQARAKAEADKKEADRLAAEKLKEDNERKAKESTVAPVITPVPQSPGPVKYAYPPEKISGAPGVSVADVLGSLQAVMDTLKAAGCDACAAKLVLMRELKKYKGVN